MDLHGSVSSGYHQKFASHKDGLGRSLARDYRGLSYLVFDAGELGELQVGDASFLRPKGPLTLLVNGQCVFGRLLGRRDAGPAGRLGGLPIL